MLKLKNVVLCALALLPTTAIAHAPAPSTAQTETANDHAAAHRLLLCHEMGSGSSAREPGARGETLRYQGDAG